MTADRPLRILHCFRSPIGGIFRHVRDLVDEHVAAGHQVGILCDSSTGGAHEDRLFDAIRPKLALGLLRMPIGRSIRPSDIKALAASYSEIRKLQPDVLHGHGAKGGVIARVVGSLLRVNQYRVSRFYSPHGGSLHYDRGTLKGEIVLRIERLLEPLSDGLCFVCGYEQDTYVRKVGTPKAAARMIYNGIPESDFVRCVEKPDAGDFLYLGMMRDLKGPDVFIEALVQAEAQLGRPLRATMIGDGPDKDRYAAMIIEKGLSDRVSLLPAMSKDAAFEHGKIVVVPSRAEAMPYIVLEALAAGKALIASRVGGIPEVLGTDNPALVEPGNPQALALQMVAALTQPDWRAKVIPDVAGFHHRFSSVTMAADLLAFYRDSLKR